MLPAILLVAVPMSAAEPTATAATAINALGVDLLHQAARPEANFLLSPYSIQTALAMTYAGADGATRDEMARVLHFPKDDAELHRSFTALRTNLEVLIQRSARAAERMKEYGITNDPMVLTAANRLFGQTGYDFRAAFLARLKDEYGAPFQPMDFVRNADGATKQINEWVQQQTRQRIRDLIPPRALDQYTRLVLVNAIYLKAPWARAFPERATQPRAFHAGGGAAVEVPTMTEKLSLSYEKRDGYAVVAIPYQDANLHFLILLPDKVDGLAALERKVTAGLLAGCARLPGKDVILFLPKFKLEPPTLPLGEELQRLGMNTAFDKPPRSANFDRMAPRHLETGDYLFISEVFHKTFLKLDEKGTEAAAATAVAMAVKGMAAEKPKPIEVKVDRPFFFAIQHAPSGACLFLGHVTDPR